MLSLVDIIYIYFIKFHFAHYIHHYLIGFYLDDKLLHYKAGKFIVAFFFLFFIF